MSLPSWLQRLGGASDGHAVLALRILTIQVEGGCERILAQMIGLLIQLVMFTLWETTELEGQRSSGGALASGDMAADGDR